MGADARWSELDVPAVLRYARLAPSAEGAATLLRLGAGAAPAAVRSVSLSEGLAAPELMPLLRPFGCLARLDLSGCPSLPGRHVAHAIELCRGTLLELSLRGCSLVTDRDLLQGFRLNPDAFAAVDFTAACPLRKLDLKGCLEHRIVTSGLSLGIIAPRCRQLESISVGWESEFRGDGFSEPYLMMFQIPGADITASGLAGLGYCTSLKQVDLSGCAHAPEPALAQLVHRCTQLESLNLNQCLAVTDHVVAQIASTSLTSLNLRGNPVVTDGVLAAKLLTMPAIRRLNLSCTLLAGDWLGGLPTLTHLDLCYCHAVTRDTLVGVLRSLSEIEDLGISGCALTTVDLVDVARHHPGLRFVGFGGCPHLSSSVLPAFVEHCPRLVSLYVADSSWLTDDAVRAVTEQLPELSSINVSGCEHVSEALESICRQRLRYAHREW